jgi:hypothetical protein
MTEIPRTMAGRYHQQSHESIPSTTIPIIATAANATSLTKVNTLFTIVPHRDPIALRQATIQTQITATNLSAQSGVLSFGASRRKSIRFTYSANIIAMIAADPGFNAVIAVHENKNADKGPKI